MPPEPPSMDEDVPDTPEVSWRRTPNSHGKTRRQCPKCGTLSSNYVRCPVCRSPRLIDLDL